MRRWWMSVAAAMILGCFSTLWGADSIVAVATVTDLSALTKQTVDFAEVSGNDKIKMGAYGLKIFTEQPQFTDAIDKSRPAAALAWLPDGGSSLRGFLVIPLKSGDALRKMLPGSWNVEYTENGIAKITVKKGETVRRVFYAVEYDSWLVLSDNQANFPMGWEPWQIDEAKQLLEKLAASRDLGVTLYVNRLPVEIRREVLEQWTNGLRRGIQKNRGKLGEELSKSLLGKLDRLAQKAESAEYFSPVETLSWNLIWDENADTLNVRLEATAQKDSSLGQELKTFAESASTVLGRFGSSESLFSSQVSLTIPCLASEEATLLGKRYLKQWLQKIRTQTVSPEVAETIEKFVWDSADSWKQAFLNPKVEEGFQISLSPENFLVMWGRAVPNSEALEKQFQEIVQFVKEQEKDDLREIVVESGKDVVGEWRVYYANFALPENSSCPHAQCLRSVCGNSIQGCVVFAPKAIYYALGKNAKTDLLAFLKSDAACPTTVSALQWDLSLRELLKWAAVHGHQEQTRIRAEIALKKMGDVGTGTVSLKLIPVENGLGLELQWTPSAIQMLKGI